MHGLTSVVIGKGLTFRGVGAFSYCENLVGVYFKGNAPTPGFGNNGEDIFYVDPLVTLYYLPGTTGWGPTYANTAAVLWNPQVRSDDGSIGFRQNSQFGFSITGTAEIPVVIEASTNFGSGWVPLQSCSLTNGLLYFSDSKSTKSAARVYRIRSP